MGTPGGSGDGEGERNSSVQCDVECELKEVQSATFSQIKCAEKNKANGLLLKTRLTYNYWRKGGYSVGSEDYRWEIVRNKTGRFIMFLFDIVFISSFQSVRTIP